MKKKIILAVLMVCLLCGCEKTIPKLKNGEEAVITFKDNEKISVDELYGKMKDSYATGILVEMMDNYILEKEYSKKMDDAEEYAKNQVEAVKNYYKDEKGNFDEASLISAINQYYGFTTIKEYQDSLEINYLRDLAIKDYVKKRIKDSEINKYYDKEIVGDRKVSHIQIIPDVKDNMTDDEKKEAEKKALNEAKSIVAKLKKGEKFETLAKKFSDDENTKDAGGNLGFINKGFNNSKTFDDEVYSLKVGSYSHTPIKTENGYEIIQVVEQKKKKPLKDVKKEIVDVLVNKKLQEEATLSIDAIKDLRKKYEMEITDDELNKSYNKYMNNLYDAAKRNNAKK